MPLLLPAGYKNRKQTVFDEKNPSARVRQVEHWDGSMDAIVKPKSFGVKLTATDGAPASKDHIAAIHEYEAAVRHMETAHKVADPHWIRKAETRLRVAKERLQTVQ